MASGNGFSGSDILSFIFSLKPSLPLEGDQYLKKSYLCQWKSFSLIFLDTDSNGSSLLVHLYRIFQLILHPGQWKRFLVNYKPFAFIRSFFLLVETIHEIKCRPIFKEEQYSCSLEPFSWIFSDIPSSVSSFFRLVETEFSLDPSSRLVYTDFGLISNLVFFRSFFLVLESITEIRCKPVFFDFFSS